MPIYLHKLVLLLLLSISSSAFSLDPLKIEIRTIGFPPYGILNDGVASGIYYDLANNLAEAVGLDASNTVAPYTRIRSGLKSGRADLSIMFKYSELNDYVVYVAPLPTLKTVVVGLKGSSFDSIQSLENKRIAYLRGGSFSEQIDDNPKIQKYRTTNFQQGVKMLLGGRVDAIIGPMEPILAAAAKSNLSNDLFGAPFVVAERTPWIQISKKSALVPYAELLRKEFALIQARGDLELLRRHYTQN